MNKSFKFFSLSLLLLFGVGKGFSQQTIEQNGVIYHIFDEKVSVIGFSENQNEFRIENQISYKHNGKDYKTPVTQIVIDYDLGLPVMVIEKLYIPPTINRISSGSFNKIDVKNLYILDLAAWCGINFEYTFSSGTTGTYYSSAACPINSTTNFYVNRKLVETLEIPDEVQEISPFAFNNLNCKSVIIGNNVSYIGMHAFENSSLEELNLGTSVKNVEEYAFYQSENLSSITLSPTLQYVGRSAFYDNTSNEETIHKTLNVYAPSAEVVAYLDAPYSFYNPDFYPPFRYSYNLYIDNELSENLVIKAQGNDMGDFCFSGVNNVKSLTFEEGITSAGYDSFIYCLSLQDITFPSTFETITTTFNHCPELKSITFKCPLPPGHEPFVIAMWDEISQELRENCTLYVPEESVELYKSDWFWGQFYNILPIDETTSVDSLPADSEDISGKVIYDLQGRKVSGGNFAPGIYVIDGKKIKI